MKIQTWKNSIAALAFAASLFGPALPAHAQPRDVGSPVQIAAIDERVQFTATLVRIGGAAVLVKSSDGLLRIPVRAARFQVGGVTVDPHTLRLGTPVTVAIDEDVRGTVSQVRNGIVTINLADGLLQVPATALYPGALPNTTVTFRDSNGTATTLAASTALSSQGDSLGTTIMSPSGLTVTDAGNSSGINPPTPILGSGGSSFINPPTPNNGAGGSSFVNPPFSNGGTSGSVAGATNEGMPGTLYVPASAPVASSGITSQESLYTPVAVGTAGSVLTSQATLHPPTTITAPVATIATPSTVAITAPQNTGASRPYRGAQVSSNRSVVTLPAGLQRGVVRSIQGGQVTIALPGGRTYATSISSLPYSFTSTHMVSMRDRSGRVTRMSLNRAYDAYIRGTAVIDNATQIAVPPADMER